MPRLKQFSLFVVAVVCISLPGNQMIAQTVSGRISGTVVDGSGNAVVGATVTLINERTGDARTVVTSQAGDFSFAALQPGTYSIKVEQKGFTIFRRQGNVLTAAEHLSVGELPLKVG